MQSRRILPVVVIVLAGLLLGLFTTSRHVRTRGLQYLEEGSIQHSRHQEVLDGHAGNPWQYRILTPYMIDRVTKLFERLGVPHHVAASFIFFRTLLDAILLLLSYVYYRKLGLSLPSALIGMILLAWGISYSHYDSDLSFNTFFEVICYLLAGLCILGGRFVWIVPITLCAALNRETSILIPFLLLFFSLSALPEGSWRRVIPVFTVAVVLYGAVFVGLRTTYPEQQLLIPYGQHAGLELLRYNLFRAVTWEQLTATLSIIPIVALIGFSRWPMELRIFFWVIVPIWFIVHGFGAVMAETRILLVPQALIFIPGALFFAQQQGMPDRESGFRAT